MDYYCDGCYYLNIEKELENDDIVFSNLSKGYESKESKINKTWMVVRNKPQHLSQIRQINNKNQKAIFSLGMGCRYNKIIQTDLDRYKNNMTDTEIYNTKFREVFLS